MKQICSNTSISEMHRIHFSDNTCTKKSSDLIRKHLFLVLTIAVFFLTGMMSKAETYYSQGSVAVNNINSWNTLAGGGGLAPVDFTGTHTWIIQSGHNMEMTGDWTLGGTATVTIDGSLTVSSTYLVSITGSLTVNGTLTNSGTYTAASAITATDGIMVNGTYNHNQNDGYIPTGTWSTGSTCLITGWTSATSLGNSSFDQPFVNFTWDCPNQSSSVSFAGHVANVPGTFTLISTGPVGSGDVPLYVIGPGGNPTYGNYSSTGGDYNVTYGGVARTVAVTNDFNLSGGHFYQSRYALGSLTVGGNYSISAGTHIVARTAGASASIAGDFSMTGGYFRVAYDQPGTFAVMGDFSITGPGTFNMSGANVTGVLYVAGDFTHTSGWITESSTGSGEIVFNGTGTQTFTSTRTITELINFTVNGGATLQMATENTYVSSVGTFTLSAGGTLGVTSANGITADPAVATGNIRTTTARVFSEGANYIYNGTTPQVTGTGLTQNTPANLNISNSSGVTLSDETSISMILTLSSGSLITGSNTLILNNASSGAASGGSASSYVRGTLRRNIASGANTYAFPIGTSSGFTPVSLLFGSGTAGGYLNIFSTDGDHPEIRTSDFDPDRTVNRTWTFQTSGGLGTVEYNALLNWSAADMDAGFDYATAVAGQYAGSAWTLPVINTNTETSIQATGLTGFGDFQVGNDLNVSQPTVQASAVVFQNVNAGDLTVSWTNGDGATRVVLMKSGSAVDSYPAGRVTYVADALFGNGTQAGNGNYAIYNDTGSSVKITGLTPGTTYHVAVFEYNGPEGHEDYLVDNPATGYRQTAAAGIYRSAGTGNWNVPGTWEFYDGSTWAAAVSTPSSLDYEVTVLAGHTVSVTEDVDIDQLSVSIGGQITVAPGITLNVNNGPDEYDITVNGSIINSGTITGTGAASVNGVLTNGGDFTVSGLVSVNGGGRYIHSTSGTTLPAIIWQTGSTCEITGWTNATTLTPSFDQEFYNFTWNCPNQAVNVSFAGYADMVAGTFTLNSTGLSTSYLIAPGGNATYGNYISNSGTYDMTYGGTVARSVTITNDFVLNNGRFYQSTNARGTLSIGHNYTINNNGVHVIGRTSGSSANVGRDFLMTGGYFRVAYDQSGTLTVLGDFSLTGGTFNMSDADVAGILYLAGDFTFTAGAISETGTGSGEIVFNGSGTQLFTSSRPATETINFTVNDRATLQMASAGSFISSGSTFTLAAGGTLGITSADGITADPAVASGNIRTTTARVFSDGANYIYNGTIPQVTGTGLTQHTPANLSVNNNNGLTLSAATTIANSFSISVSSRVNLGAGLSHAAKILILGGAGQSGGTYGGTGSGAVNIIPQFFDAATGILDNACPAGTWLGGTSADWNTASNWSGGIPSATTDAFITSAITNQPVISASLTADCNNLIIDPTASLTIKSAGVTSSGSLIVHGTSTGNVTYNRIMPSDLYRYVSSPVSADVLPTGTTFWRWNETLGAWGEDVSETPTTACSSGLGYTMLASNNMVSFTGSVVKSASQTGTAPFYYPGTYANNRGTWGGGGCNLLGNPFTSAMSATTFINVNGASGNNSLDPNYNAVYIYNGSSYTYIGSQIPDFPNSGTFGDDNIQAGQGFFVFANYNGVPFNFTSDMQIHDVSVPMMKSAKAGDDSWSGLMLKVKYNDRENSTLVVYNENMTAGLDPGYDIGHMSAGADAEIYTTLVSQENSVNFARQALPISGATTITVPVGIDMEKGGEVTFSAYIVPIGDKKFLLEDRVTGLFTDLGTLSYTVTLPAKTYGTGRFFIIASTNAPTIIEKPQTEDSGLQIWTSDDKVIIRGEVSEMTLCEIYDAGGRKITDTRLDNSGLNTVEIPFGSSGVYIVRVVDGVKVIVRKVVLF